MLNVFSWSLLISSFQQTLLSLHIYPYFIVLSYLFLLLFTARSPGEPIVNPGETLHLSIHLLLPSFIPWFIHFTIFCIFSYLLYRTISCTGLFHERDHWCSTWHYCRSPDFWGDFKDGGSVRCRQRWLHTMSHVDMRAVSRCRKAYAVSVCVFDSPPLLSSRTLKPASIQFSRSIICQINTRNSGLD